MSPKVCKLVAGTVAIAALSGCQPSPFKQALPQTPYQRYAQLRGQDRDASSPREQRGGTTPQELRRRLAPLEQQ